LAVDAAGPAEAGDSRQSRQHDRHDKLTGGETCWIATLVFGPNPVL